MTVDGRSVANYVLDRCDHEGRAITNLALQKIVYFCHAWCLAILRKPLVKHQFEAWQFGPVLQYLYRDFREFDREPISRRASKLNPLTGEKEVVKYQLDDDVRALLDQVIDFYSCLNAGALVELTHAPGSPWDLIWNHEGKINPGMKISDELIGAYYSGTPAPFQP